MLFIYFLKIYLFDRDSERGNTSRGSVRGRSRLPTKWGARCREHDAGLDPRTLGS